MTLGDRAISRISIRSSTVDGGASNTWMLSSSILSPSRNVHREGSHSSMYIPTPPSYPYTSHGHETERRDWYIWYATVPSREESLFLFEISLLTRETMSPISRSCSSIRDMRVSISDDDILVQYVNGRTIITSTSTSSSRYHRYTTSTSILPQ